MAWLLSDGETSRLQGHSLKLKKDLSTRDLCMFKFIHRVVNMWNDLLVDFVTTSQRRRLSKTCYRPTSKISLDGRQRSIYITHCSSVFITTLCTLSIKGFGGSGYLRGRCMRLPLFYVYQNPFPNPRLKVQVRLCLYLFPLYYDIPITFSNMTCCPFSSTFMRARLR